MGKAYNAMKKQYPDKSPAELGQMYRQRVLGSELGDLGTGQ
jgi:hypothetical protein